MISSDHIIGFVFGVLLTVIVANLPFSKLYKYNSAIKDCERNLPRELHCIITAIPNDESNR